MSLLYIRPARTQPSHVLPYTHRAHATVMIAKLITLWCACAAAMAAPGIYDGVGLGAAYGLAPGIGVGHGIGIGHGIGVAHGIAPAIGIAAAPLVKQVVAAPVVHAEPIDPNPAYSFSYGVSDPHTGDQKNQAETLQNGVVHGSYSLVEPDGHLRRVTYTADKINGFNAVVERTGGAHAGPVGVAKVIAAPAPVAVAAPVGYAHGVPALGHPWG